MNYCNSQLKYVHTFLCPPPPTPRCTLMCLIIKHIFWVVQLKSAFFLIFCMLGVNRVSARKTSHEHTYKDRNRLRQLSPGMRRVNTRCINFTKGIHPQCMRRVNTRCINFTKRIHLQCMRRVNTRCINFTKRIHLQCMRRVNTRCINFTKRIHLQCMRRVNTRCINFAIGIHPQCMRLWLCCCSASMAVHVMSHVRNIR